MINNSSHHLAPMIAAACDSRNRVVWQPGEHLPLPSTTAQWWVLPRGTKHLVLRPSLVNYGKRASELNVSDRSMLEYNFLDFNNCLAATIIWSTGPPHPQRQAPDNPIWSALMFRYVLAIGLEIIARCYLYAFLVHAYRGKTLELSSVNACKAARYSLFSFVTNKW